MTPQELRARLAPDADAGAFQRLLQRLPEEAPEDWRALAALGALVLQSCRVIGISGGQGAGKSTLAALLTRALELGGRRTVACSLDDFYLTRDARNHLGERVHPLLVTRGVPGTHDVELALDTIASLVSGTPTRLPRFDKGRDDRAPEPTWMRVQDIRTVVFEGWCLGVDPQPEALLETPLNGLEAEEDAEGCWRAYANSACRTYAPLWALVDWWIFLEVPDMDAVRRWRSEQEAVLPEPQRMSATELSRFIAHYERLTSWLKSCFAERAHWRLSLDARHRVSVAEAWGPAPAGRSD